MTNSLRHGKVIAAEAILVERILQGEKRYGRIVKWAVLRIMEATELPDFLVLIDRNIWDGMGLEEKLALVDHELMHAAFATEDDGVTQKFRQDGSPRWAIRGHDVEDFASVVERNGLWNEDLVVFARAIVNALNNPALVRGGAKATQERA